MNMSKSTLQPLKGFRDFLPDTMIIRNEAIRRVKSVFEKYGFEELQTPYLEHQDVLLGKYGAEAEKLMYLFNDPGKRPVGLRYDLTVPLARVAATHPNLIYPFKRYQIQPVWRAENTQKGRYREFYQCDVDTLGSNSPLADAEILAVIYETLQILEFPEFTIKVNSRPVLFSTMEKSGVEKDKWLDVIQSIDKLDKKSKEEVETELAQKGYPVNTIKLIFDSLDTVKPDDFLQRTIATALKLGIDEKSLVFDPHLARGLDYYTGPIFETVVTLPKIGSITGGGRYDQLLKSLGGPDIQAVGTTIGLDRACDVITELGLWKNVKSTKTDVLVTVFSQELENESLTITKHLRENGLNTEVYLSDTARLDKQLKYADRKGINWLVVIGPEEAEKGTAILKNLKTGHQEEVKTDDLASRILK
jgi:histidyl-tRNA synthetase